MNIYSNQAKSMPSMDADEARENADLLSDLHQYMANWQDYAGIGIQEGKRDSEFINQSQFNAQELGEFKRLKKPQLTMNKLYDFTKKTIAEQRQNTSSVKVRSKDYIDEEDSKSLMEHQKAIDLRLGILKQLDYNNHADIQYQTCFAKQVYQGMGVIAQWADYEDSNSFDQTIYMRAEQYPECCFFDPNAKEVTKHDGDYCGRTSIISKQFFQKQYPDTPIPVNFPSQDTFDGLQWVSKDTVTICEWWRKEYYNKCIYNMSVDGNIEVWQEDQYKQFVKSLKQLQKDNPVLAFMGEQRVFLVDERETTDYKIMYYKCTADSVLEKKEFPSKYLGLIFADGDSYYDNGQQFMQSLIRHAKDAQRLLNYIAIEIASAMRNSRRENYLVTDKMIQGESMERIWKNPELQQGALPFIPDSRIIGGAPLRQQPAELSQTNMAYYQMVDNDIKAILGVYDENLGNASNAISGTAINARIGQGNISTSIFKDNLDRVIEQVNRMRLDMLPRVFDNERSIVIPARDGSYTSIKINQQMPDGTIKNDMTEGNYDIELSTGQPSELQQKQANEMLMQIMMGDPQQFVPLLADLFAQTLDLSNKDQIVERFKTIVPPAVLAKEKGEPPPPPPPPPPQMQMEMQEQQQKHQISMQEMALKQKELQLKEKDLQLQEQGLYNDSASNELEKLKTLQALQQAPIDSAIAQQKNQAEIVKSEQSAKASVMASLAKIHTANVSLRKQPTS